MSFVVDGDEHMVVLVNRQVPKSVDVTRVEDLSDHQIVARELALVRVATNADTRSEIVQMVNIYRGEIVDVALDSMVVQIVGSEDRVDSLIALLDHFGIQGMVRTGRVAVVRGAMEKRLRRASTVWRAQANGKDMQGLERLRTGGV